MAAQKQIRQPPANFNSPPDDCRLVEIEAARGQQKTGLEHVSVPVRRVLARSLSHYRNRIDDER